MNLIQTCLYVSLLSSFLVGCSVFSSPDTKCMKTVLVSSLSKFPLHSVVKNEPRAVSISSFKAGCGGSEPDLPGGMGDIGINMTFLTPEARHGTGNDKKVVLPVFVALLDKSDNVLDRQDENVEVIITDHALAHIHKITYHPPEGIDVNSDAYRVLVGFKESLKAAHSAETYHHVVKKPAHKKIRKGTVKQNLDAKEATAE